MTKLVNGFILFLLATFAANTALAQAPTRFDNANSVKEFMSKRPQFKPQGASKPIIEMWWDESSDLFFMKANGGKSAILLKTPVQRVQGQWFNSQRVFFGVECQYRDVPLFIELNGGNPYFYIEPQETREDVEWMRAAHIKPTGDVWWTKYFVDEAGVCFMSSDTKPTPTKYEFVGFGAERPQSPPSSPKPSSNRAEKITAKEPEIHSTLSHPNAQRVNADGRKLVKTLRTTVIDRWGKEGWPWLNRTYAFEYESDGRLKKVTRQWIDEGDKNFETLEHNEEGYHYNHLVNGRSVPKLNVEYVTNRKGYIRSVIEDVKEAHETWRKDSVGWNYHRTATVYSPNYKVLTFDFIGSKPRKEEWKNGHLTQNLTFSLKELPSFDRFNEDDFKDMGMNGYVLEFLSRDSVSYTPMFDGSDFYNNNNGNLIRIPCSYNRETVYLNDKNDINLFLLPLSHIWTLNHYYNNIEAVTEWIGFSSKNLIEYENCSPTRKYYDAHWIYERDSNDNIVKIIIERPNDYACKIILDLEYVM